MGYLETLTMVLFSSGWPSQWHPSPFTIDKVRYSCTEQYMMSEKADFFGDSRMLTAIRKERSPREQKALGRRVTNFDEKKWRGVCKDIVYRGNLAKFSQNDDLKKKLLATGKKLIVEASPNDRIWGIGLATDDPKAQQRQYWKGTNWLGEILMQVRSELSKG